MNTRAEPLREQVAEFFADLVPDRDSATDYIPREEWERTWRYRLADRFIERFRLDRAKRLQSAHHRMLRVTAVTCDACRAERALAARLRSETPEAGT